MKTWTAFSRSLMLMALLAVSWAAAAPLQGDPGNDVSEDEVMTYFEDRPDAAVELLPDLINQATSIEVTVDDDVLADLIEKKLAQDALEKERQKGNQGRKKRQVKFDFGNAEMGSGFNFQGVGTMNDSSHKDYSLHDSNNWSDSSHKDWSTHDSSRKDWSTHDSSQKDWSKHDSSHKDWSTRNEDRSHKDYSISKHTSNTEHNHALFGWGK